MNDCAIKLDNGPIVKWSFVNPAHALDDFAFASVIAKRDTGLFLRLAHLDGDARALVEQLEQLRIEFVNSASPIVDVH